MPTDKITVNNFVVISDTHCGCRLGLCPPKGGKLDDGGRYEPSVFQQKTWAMFDEFFKVHVPVFTKGEPYAVCVNGDAVDGDHHRATTQISHNPVDQARIFQTIMEPIIAHKKCVAYYHIRGTEAHVGQSACEEEALAKSLGAIPNKEGQYARWDLWKKVGDGLVHLLHHIGTTGSAAYEATAVNKELTESYVESPNSAAS